MLVNVANVNFCCCFQHWNVKKSILIQCWICWNQQFNVECRYEPEWLKNSPYIFIGFIEHSSVNYYKITNDQYYDIFFFEGLRTPLFADNFIEGYYFTVQDQFMVALSGLFFLWGIRMCWISYLEKYNPDLLIYEEDVSEN